MISAGMAFGSVFVSAVFVLAVNIAFMPAVSKAGEIAMLFIIGIAILFIRVTSGLLIGIWFVAVMIVPAAVGTPVAGVPIDPFMIPV